MISPSDLPLDRDVLRDIGPAATGPAVRRTLAGHASAYLIGIGGTGMCGAAELLKARGLVVAGSDRAASRRTERLGRVGIPVDVGEDHALPSLPDGATLVVATAAAPASHPQLVEARERGLAVWKYAECLGALMDGRLGIAVAGCHGKTTTSSLVATTLWRAGRDPSFVIGGEVRDLSTSSRPGRGPHFVAEACEYDRSFHRLRPTIALVTNVDADHLDYYRDLEEIRESFRDFARLVPAHGMLVVHEEHVDVFRRDARIVARIETYGTTSAATWRAMDVRWDAEAQVGRWTLWRGGEEMGALSVPLTGVHNVLNATGAAAALSAAGLSFDEIAGGISQFGGVGRRLEIIADRGGVVVLDDYGHHPAEIEAVVRGLRARYPGRRVVVVFQPHQASRTRQLLDGFAGALASADEAWLAPIYLARDSDADRRSVTSDDVALKIAARGGAATVFSDFHAVVEHAARAARPGDVLVTMGAGNIDDVARSLARRLRDTEGVARDGQLVLPPR